MRSALLTVTPSLLQTQGSGPRHLGSSKAGTACLWLRCPVQSGRHQCCPS